MDLLMKRRAETPSTNLKSRLLHRYPLMVANFLIFQVLVRPVVAPKNKNSKIRVASRSFQTAMLR